MSKAKEKQNKEGIFSYKHVNGQGTICMQLHGKERMVYPYELYRALWDGNERVKLCQGVEARFMKFASEIEGIYMDDGCGRYRESYKPTDFVDSAIEALQALCVDVCSFNQTRYGDNIRAGHAERMLEGLLSGILERRSMQIFADDIMVEDFGFDFVEEYDCDTGFILRIGGREYRSCMSDWSNNLDLIRHEMERLTIEKNDDKCQLRIHFEDSPNTLQMEHRVIHGNNRYADLAKVTITPDEYVGGPILFGWCKKRQVLKALYQGFLRLFIRESKAFEHDEYCRSWNEFRLAAYNKLQSCIIEDYLMGVENDDLIYRPRQRIVHTVAEMKADYAALVEKLNSIFFLLNLE